MNAKTKKIILNDGTVVREPVSVSKRLNLSIIELLENAQINEYGLPILNCSPIALPTYCALCTEKKDFNKTPYTAVAHYVYDRTFDSQKGIFNAIYFNDIKRLEYYKKYYSPARFIISCDNSIFDDIGIIASRENDYRIEKIYITNLWFTLNTNAVVIPNAIYAPTDKLDEYMSGYKNCSVICFSTKSHIRHAKDRKRIRETVKYVVDNFKNLNTILIFSVCGKDETSLKLFEYAQKNRINTLILPNSQRTRNKKLGVTK